jgi:hypothetical protein
MPKEKKNMQNVKATLDQLKKQGITSKVIINLPAETPDIPKAKALQAELQKAGIIAEFHINLDLGAGTGAGEGEGTGETGATGDSFEVMVAGPKLNCWTFKQKDGAGKPVMTFPNPRVQIKQGERFKVSATAKVGSKDKGDGTIVATGGVIYHLVSECLSNPTAVGLYVRQVDITRL